jgi:hypothetical protein
MGRRARDTEAAEEFGDNLRGLIDQAGSPSDEVIARRIYRLGAEVSSAVVGKARRGELDPQTASAELVLGLCSYFEVAPDDLHPVLGRRMAGLLALPAARRKASVVGIRDRRTPAEKPERPPYRKDGSPPTRWRPAAVAA